MLLSSRTRTGPDDCALGVCIPLTPTDFHADWNDVIRKDFARHVGRAVASETAAETWNTFYAEHANRVSEAVERVQGLGVAIYPRLTLEQFPDVFLEHKVVTLIAHWRAPTHEIEFADGFHEGVAVARTVPQSYRGVLDLTVCNSDKLCELVKEYSRCTCIANFMEADLLVRLAMYEKVISLLATIGGNYLAVSQSLREQVGVRLAQRRRRRNR